MTEQTDKRRWENWLMPTAVGGLFGFAGWAGAAIQSMDTRISVNRERLDALEHQVDRDASRDVSFMKEELGAVKARLEKLEDRERARH